MNEITQSPKPLHQIRVEFNQEEMDKIIGTVSSLSGETKIPHLLDVLANQGFERNYAEDIVQQLVDTRKIIIDNEGYICWTYNPILAAHYRSHPDLRIR